MSQEKTARPLSPHLQIYKPQITSVLSILHRISGVALCLGAVALVIWLAALAQGPESYESFLRAARSTTGQLFLFGVTVAFFYHLCAGIRHLLWDAGYFFSIPSVYKSGRIVLAATAILTALTWLKIYGVTL